MNQHIVKTEFQRKSLLATVEKMELPECGVMFEWFNADDKRTAQQNKLLWCSAYRPIAEYLSNESGKIITTDMVHCVCKDKFLDKILVPRKDGTHKSYSSSTTKLGKKAFSDYLEQVYAWGAEMGVWFE